MKQTPKQLLIVAAFLPMMTFSASSYAQASLEQENGEQENFEPEKNQQQDCSLNQLSSVLDFDAALVTRKYGLSLAIDNTVCRVLPHNKEQALLSYFQYYQSDEDGYFSNLWRVLLVNRYSNKVEASYTGVIQESSTIKSHSDSNSIDSRQYALSENTQAFGLILDLANYDTSPQEQAYRAFKTSRFLTLFVQEGDKLRPVLKHLPLDYEIEAADTGGSNGGVYLHYGVQGTVELLPTTSHGYHDLKLVTQGQQYRTDGEYDQTEVISFSTELNYNGSRYPVITEQLPAPEFWQINQNQVNQNQVNQLGVNFLGESNDESESSHESASQTNPNSSQAESQNAN
ncbi:PA3715 family protein [Shewanella sp. 30m-9]